MAFHTSSDVCPRLYGTARDRANRRRAATCECSCVRQTLEISLSSTVKPRDNHMPNCPQYVNRPDNNIELNSRVQESSYPPHFRRSDLESSNIEQQSRHGTIAVTTIQPARPPSQPGAREKLGFMSITGSQSQATAQSMNFKHSTAICQAASESIKASFRY